MQDHSQIQEIILRYLDDPKNENLIREINNLRNQSEDNEKLYQEVKKIWDASPEALKLEGISLKAAVSNFKAKLDDLDEIRPSRTFKLRRILTSAAVLTCILGVWVFYQKASVNYLVKETHNQIDSIFLSDGSKVVLAKNTVVSYPEKFKGDQRQISLQKGQAFFYVHKDPEHPFEVSIRQSTVKVLGTSFNILYSDSEIKLSVKTGRVMFTPNKKSSPSILTAGQGISFNYSENTLVMDDGKNANSWLTKELQFVDMPLKDVCKQLSDYYGVHIELENEFKNAKKFNANFKNISLEEALTVLKETYSIKIKRTNQNISIKNL